MDDPTGMCVYLYTEKKLARGRSTEKLRNRGDYYDDLAPEPLLISSQSSLLRDLNYIRIIHNFKFISPVIILTH